MKHPEGMRRRDLLMSLAAMSFGASSSAAQPARLHTRPIPSSGENLPVIGLGTWITFNVGNDPQARDSCAQVMRAFFAQGGRLIDSSPMYGSSQNVIGYGLGKLGQPPGLFSADKVWISRGASGPVQIETSRGNWGVPRFDLLQVHNLLSWEAHLKTLAEKKAAGEVRYIGITTSEGRRHAEFERIMRQHRLDFVQLTYNIVDREAETRLLPLALARGIGVIANRPFQEGALLERLARYPLPAWAGEIECNTWAEFVLKFIVSHPAVTCAIPATTRVDHVQENMRAAYGPLPDEAMRTRMASFVKEL